VTALDVTGLGFGDRGLEALGQSLRKNRRLQRLFFDGNGGTLKGYQALRGAFYGNKKVIEISYPATDLQANMK
jgi:hypothetical protein